MGNMAILKIIKDDDPILRKVSRKVDKITPRISGLIDDMIATLRKAEGAGLAAVQVGVLRRIVLIETEPDNLYVLINPEIISESEEIQETVEGCLSIPEKWGITCRPKTVTVKALNRDGEEFTLTGSDMLAKAIRHEVDHLEGILFTDVVTRMLTEEELDELRNGGDDEYDDEDDYE
jgi:peptide deformylase